MNNMPPKKTFLNKITAITAGLCLVSLAACQNYETRQANYTQKINHWVGQPEAALVATLGAPAAFYDSKGSRFLTYRRSYTEGYRVPADCTNNGGGRFCYGGEFISSTYVCQETFEVQGGVVRRVNFVGDGCF